MIQVSIADNFAAAGIEVTLACIQARVAVEKASAHLGQALRLEADLRVESLDHAPVSEVPAIAAARRAFKALGKDPSRYRVSSEALMRRLAQGKALYRINTVVDTNNLVSLHTGLSAGTYRVAALQPPLVLRKGGPGETYQAIGRGPFNLESLPVLADAQGPFGSPTSDSERSMIALDAEEVLMVLYAFGNGSGLPRALDFAVDCLTSYCHARDVETALITARGSG